MKPLLLSFLLSLFIQNSFAQSLDYISIRKKNGRVIKNIYNGSHVLLQTVDGSYLQGPVNAIRNDSIFLTIYDIRLYQTIWGSIIRDTITSTLVGMHYKDIGRVHLNRRTTFVQRSMGPLLMLGGAGYLAVNVLNGALFDIPIADKQNLKRLGTAAGLFGIGYLIQKLFSSDGFSKKKHQVLYVDL
ncbi:MAG TPA: hypothetical protein VF609_06505 [Flavisolibacter sp.]